jgi:hypothetical protein
MSLTVVWRVAFASVCALTVACGGDASPDEDADTLAETEDTTPPDPAEVVGDWRAAESGIGDAFQGGGPRLVEVVAHFYADGTYANNFAFDDGSSFQASGAYAIDASTYPWGVLLDQQLPSPDPLSGIGALDGDTLQLDVISTFIAEPTTPEQGIGGGALGETTVITLQRL